MEYCDDNQELNPIQLDEKVNATNQNTFPEYPNNSSKFSEQFPKIGDSNFLSAPPNLAYQNAENFVDEILPLANDNISSITKIGQNNQKSFIEQDSYIESSSGNFNQEESLNETETPAREDSSSKHLPIYTKMIEETLQAESDRTKEGTPSMHNAPLAFAENETIDNHDDNHKPEDNIVPIVMKSDNSYVIKNLKNSSSLDIELEPSCEYSCSRIENEQHMFKISLENRHPNTDYNMLLSYKKKLLFGSPFIYPASLIPSEYVLSKDDELNNSSESNSDKALSVDKRIEHVQMYEKMLEDRTTSKLSEQPEINQDSFTRNEIHQEQYKQKHVSQMPMEDIYMDDSNEIDPNDPFTCFNNGKELTKDFSIITKPSRPENHKAINQMNSLNLSIKNKNNNSHEKIYQPNYEHNQQKNYFEYFKHFFK